MMEGKDRNELAGGEQKDLQGIVERRSDVSRLLQDAAQMLLLPRVL
jgi:hypothetical protein